MEEVEPPGRSCISNCTFCTVSVTCESAPSGRGPAAPSTAAAAASSSSPSSPSPLPASPPAASPFRACCCRCGGGREPGPCNGRTVCRREWTRVSSRSRTRYSRRCCRCCSRVSRRYCAARSRRAPSSRSFVRLRRCETGEETHSGVERRETGGGPPLVTSSFRFLAPAGSGGRRLFTCAGARALCSEERGPWCGVQEREREQAGHGSSGTAAHRVVHRWREGASASPERESESARVLRVRGRRGRGRQQVLVQK